jgi:hypothetical protein
MAAEKRFFEEFRERSGWQGHVLPELPNDADDTNDTNTATLIQHRRIRVFVSFVSFGSQAVRGSGGSKPNTSQPRKSVKNQKKNHSIVFCSIAAIWTSARRFIP